MTSQISSQGDKTYFIFSLIPIIIIHIFNVISIFFSLKISILKLDTFIKAHLYSLHRQGQFSWYFYHHQRISPDWDELATQISSSLLGMINYRTAKCEFDKNFHSLPNAKCVTCETRKGLEEQRGVFKSLNYMPEHQH